MRLLTNPGSNLSPAQIDRYRVMVLPQRIVVDDEAHDTREPIGFAEVDRWVATARRWPSTIGTTAAETVSAFQQAVREGAKHLMVVTTSKKIINSYDAAVLASTTFLASGQGRGVKIAVVDTGVTDIGAMLVCILAGEAMRASLPWDEIESVVQTAAAQTRMCLSVATLDNMVRGGRASFLRRVVADVLGVRPILAFMPDGAIGAAGTFRKRGESFDKLMEWMKGEIEPGRRVLAAALHTADEGPAAVLLERLHRTYDVAASFARPVAAGVYLHMGPGAIGMAVTPIDRLGWTPREIAGLHRPRA
jgi:DegV family protein with EDD domain